jgi:hypothetical protein
MTDRLDAEIDRVVREMMSDEPAPGFRHRVLARLRPARNPLSIPARLAVVVATAFVIVTLIAVLRTKPGPESEPDVAQAPPAATTPAPAQQPRALPERPAVSTPEPMRTVRAARRSTPQHVGTEITEPFESSVVIAPLEPIQPIQIARVQPREITTDDIVVPALTIERIDIEPFAPPR